MISGAFPSTIESSVSVSNRSDNDAGVDLPPGVEKRIINYRQEYPDHGYKRIQDYLRSHSFVLVTQKT